MHKFSTAVPKSSTLTVLRSLMLLAVPYRRLRLRSRALSGRRFRRFVTRTYASGLEKVKIPVSNSEISPRFSDPIVASGGRADLTRRVTRKRVPRGHRKRTPCSTLRRPRAERRVQTGYMGNRIDREHG